jgi:cytochrome c oxidase subunit 3
MSDSVVHHHAHHFESADAEFEAAKQGMWVFMVTEVLMFGGLFVAFIIFRGLYLDAFKAAHMFLDWKLGALNTIILIASSLTMVLGVTKAQRGERDRSFVYLALTFLLACGFLVVKYFEYTHKFHIGIFPAGMIQGTAPLLTGPDAQGAKAIFDAHPEAVVHAKLFFSLYFAMTGLHGLHVIIGMGLMIWLMIRTKKREFGPDFYTPVELVGFYWHFVDMVWIYLFPLLYLVG